MSTHASHVTQPVGSPVGAQPAAVNAGARLDTSAEHAARLDAADPLRPLRDEFEHPFGEDGRPLTYLCGNSLGLMPRAARALVNEELDDWSRLAVEGHLHSRRPWVDFHEHFRHLGARLVGAQPGEVVMMNSLTVNLHLMMVSFWRPEGKRTKILMERGAFPSDTYAVHSHVHARGLDPAQHVIEIGPRSGEALIREEDILDAIREAGDTLALVMIGGVNYATGQAFGIERITAAAHAVGALAGWDLAHWAGNLPARLHDWNVDFACWCSYKYLNAGPGAVAGCFVHERHGNNTALPRFAGWWGNDPKTRFAMGPEFVARAGADGWQLSNPPIMALAPLLASLQLFDRVGMDALHAKSRAVTGYLRALLAEWAPPGCRIVTPDAPGTHGAQLSIAFEHDARARHAELGRRGIVCDFREPNIVRLAPAPLYNGYADARAAAAALCGH